VIFNQKTNSLYKSVKLNGVNVSFNKSLTILLFVFLIGPFSQAQENLSLEKTVSIAQHNDLWLINNVYQQKATESLSIAAGELPDPKVTLAFLNFPTDTFDFGQEPMTQLKVGVSQMFPRGSTLALKREQLELKSDIFPFQRLNRSEKVKVIASQLWLEAFKAQESIALIEKNRSLFEQLSEVAESTYSSALGRTSQQDIVRAQLELTRLDDRLTMLNQKFDKSIQNLSGWLNDYYLQDYQDFNVVEGINQSSGIVLENKLPELTVSNRNYLSINDDNEIFVLIKNHPAIVALQQKRIVSEKSIDLAKQQYKPAWGVNASYGFRGESPSGDNRSDFLTLGVTFDVPLFTKNRQDKKLQAAVALTDAVETEEYLMLRQMLASFKAATTQLYRLDERQKLYNNILLPQMNEQAEASLSAYTNDTGDFAEVVRSRIAELNAQIDALNIDVDRQKIIAQLNYFFKQI
jgi:outer membrane protein TolC